MRCVLIGLPVVTLLAACSLPSTTSTGTGAPKPAATTVSPAAVLQHFDVANGNAGGLLSDYQAAFDKVTAKCTNDPSKLPAMVEATDQILLKAGITDETGLTLLGHLNDSIPDGSAQMDCVQVLAAYATLREG